MRVVVTGATGNVGTSVLDSLGGDDAVTSILGIARRLPAARFAKTEFVVADVARDDLAPLLEGADAVVHLAWLIQPSHDEATLRRTNVDGSSRTFAAVVAAGVPALVVASSVGAYSARVDAHPVDESWPTEGIPASWYSRQKAEVERRLDALEVEHPALRVVRLRPAITTKREAASGQRRLFAGPAPSHRDPPAEVDPVRAGRAGPDPAARPRRRRRRRLSPGGALGRSRRLQHRGRAGARPGRNRGRPRDPHAAAAGRARSAAPRAPPGSHVCSRPLPTGSTSLSARRCSTPLALARSSAGRRPGTPSTPCGRSWRECASTPAGRRRRSSRRASADLRPAGAYFSG